MGLKILSLTANNLHVFESGPSFLYATKDNMDKLRSMVSSKWPQDVREKVQDHIRKLSSYSVKVTPLPEDLAAKTRALFRLKVFGDTVGGEGLREIMRMPFSLQRDLLKAYSLLHPDDQNSDSFERLKNLFETNKLDLFLLSSPFIKEPYRFILLEISWRHVAFLVNGYTNELDRVYVEHAIESLAAIYLRHFGQEKSRFYFCADYILRGWLNHFFSKKRTASNSEFEMELISEVKAKNNYT